MKILVCISDVPDTTTKIKFKDNNTTLDVNGIQWIINPWDELALTRALELKEASGGIIQSVTVANVGTVASEPTIRKALAVGADNAIRIDAQPKDAYYVAAQLANIVKAESYDIVLVGRDSADYNGSAVGGMLAELIDYNSLSSVSSLNIENGKIRINREIDGGTETIEAELPFLAIVQKGISKEPRIPAMRGIMMARTKPLNVVQAVAVEILTEDVSFEMPQPKGSCKKFDSENVKTLVSLLHNEAKLI
ncbi:MAG: electron transfer flavoprotein subunit beta/FixA family protein [Bacteroidales bacterium]|nr:electron transfer flavoprotein subunit beta/FixA family protein [Bacteroidales bacterium]